MENLSLIREIELFCSLSKYLFKLSTPNNLYTKPDITSVRPPINSEGIVIMWIIQ